jgi:hypothetical protein
MKKRALYSIPVAGLTLTSVGCGVDEPPPLAEQLSGTFSVDVFYNNPLPYIQAGYDVNGDGTLLCDNILDADDITFDTQLSAKLIMDKTYANCQLNGAPDPASEGLQYTTSFGFDAIVVSPNAQYNIEVSNANGEVFDTLNCTLSGVAFDCKSNVAGGANFNFTKR